MENPGHFWVEINILPLSRQDLPRIDRKAQHSTAQKHRKIKLTTQIQFINTISDRAN